MGQPPASMNLLLANIWPVLKMSSFGTGVGFSHLTRDFLRPTARCPAQATRLCRGPAWASSPGLSREELSSPRECPGPHIQGHNWVPRLRRSLGDCLPTMSAAPAGARVPSAWRHVSPASTRGTSSQSREQKSQTQLVNYREPRGPLGDVPPSPPPRSRTFHGSQTAQRTRAKL